MDNSNIIAYDFMLSKATQSGTTSKDKSTVTLTESNSAIKVGHRVTGNGIPSDTKVSSISGTNLTLSSNATSSGSTLITFISERDIENYSINGNTVFGDQPPPKIPDLQTEGRYEK